MSRKGCRGAVRRCAIASLVLVAAGCSYSTDGTGSGGTLAIRTPGTLPPVTPAPAPVVQDQAPRLPGSGSYTGVGYLRGNRGQGQGCASQIRLDGFVVDGNRVRFTRFRGTINPDLTLKMQAGRRYISGHFEGDRFIGLFWEQHPGCSYDVRLNLAG